MLLGRQDALHAGQKCSQTKLNHSLLLQYGLYSAFMGSFVYCLFGPTKEITIGPVAVLALLTAEHAGGDPGLAVLLTFLSGLIITLLGALNLGNVLRTLTARYPSDTTLCDRVLFLEHESPRLAHGFTTHPARFRSK